MGSCCFMPSKKQFLWWYWLLLFSIIGIPMLAAVWFVSRQPEEKRCKAGWFASIIFWAGSIFVLIGCFIAASRIHQAMYGAARAVPQFWHTAAYEQEMVFVYLVMNFFLSLAGAQLVYSMARRCKHWYSRMPVAAGFVAFWTFMMMFFHSGFGPMPKTDWVFPPILVIQLLICAPTAFYWGRFKGVPSRVAAWKALAAALVSFLLFSVLIYYGPDFYDATVVPWLRDTGIARVTRI
jgi:phosphoglycerol transferase MdoB-like AlkP superfamily enzyme